MNEKIGGINEFSSFERLLGDSELTAPLRAYDYPGMSSYPYFTDTYHAKITLEEGLRRVIEDDKKGARALEILIRGLECKVAGNDIPWSFTFSRWSRESPLHFKETIFEVLYFSRVFKIGSVNLVNLDPLKIKVDLATTHYAKPREIGRHLAINQLETSAPIEPILDVEYCMDNWANIYVNKLDKFNQPKCQQIADWQTTYGWLGDCSKPAWEYRG